MEIKLRKSTESSVETNYVQAVSIS